MTRTRVNSRSQRVFTITLALGLKRNRGVGWGIVLSSKGKAQWSDLSHRVEIIRSLGRVLLPPQNESSGGEIRGYYLHIWPDHAPRYCAYRWSAVYAGI